MRMRGVHVGHTEYRLRDLDLFRFANASSPPAIRRPPRWSACTPLVWWPLWGYNIGEYWQNSALPLAELRAAGVIDGEGAPQLQYKERKSA